MPVWQKRGDIMMNNYTMEGRKLLEI